MSEICVYVADLAAYNAGILHGRWIDATQDVGDIEDEVQEMLAEGQRLYQAETLGIHEEWAIHDFEGFGSLGPDEWASFESVSELAKSIEEHGDAYIAYVEVRGGIDYATVDGFQDSYIGEMTALEYAYEYIDSVGMLHGVDDTIARYFDYESFARDMVIGGDITEYRGYLFYNH